MELPTELDDGLPKPKRLPASDKRADRRAKVKLWKATAKEKKELEAEAERVAVVQAGANEAAARAVLMLKGEVLSAALGVGNHISPSVASSVSSAVGGKPPRSASPALSSASPSAVAPTRLGSRDTSPEISSMPLVLDLNITPGAADVSARRSKAPRVPPAPTSMPQPQQLVFEEPTVPITLSNSAYFDTDVVMGEMISGGGGEGQEEEEEVDEEEAGEDTQHQTQEGVSIDGEPLFQQATGPQQNRGKNARTANYSEKEDQLLCEALLDKI